MKMQRSSMVAGVIVAVAVGYLGYRYSMLGSPIPGIEIPETLTLYSIDGRKGPMPAAPPANSTDEYFANYPVLGNLEITDAADREQMVAELQNAIVWNDRESPA